MARPFLARVAAVVTCLTLVGCTEQTSADAVLRGEADSVEGVSAEFVVPTGTVTVTVGEAVDSVTAEQIDGFDGFAAPEDSTFLPVGMSFESFASAAPWGGLLIDRVQETSVAIIVDGVRRPVGEPYSVVENGLGNASSRSFYAAVPGAPSSDEIEVEVTYDGAAQRATPGEEATGRAAALAELPQDAPVGAGCPNKDWRSTGFKFRVNCNVWAQRTPYWRDVGWAPEGRDWVVVGVNQLQVLSPRGSGPELQSLWGLGPAEALSPIGGDLLKSGFVVLNEDELVDGAARLRFRVDAAGPGGRDVEPVLSYDVPVQP